jgi:putative redox protein
MVRMADQRRVTLERVDEGVYRARNARGGELVFGSKAGDGFTPVELLLAAIAGCSAVDVDVVTGRRSAADEFTAEVTAGVLKDENGQHLDDVTLTFRIRFPEGEAGDAAREILPRALKTSHDRTCTVSRSLELGTKVTTTAE